MKPNKFAPSLAFRVMLFACIVSAPFAGSYALPAPPAPSADKSASHHFSDAGKAAITQQLRESVARGDTPGVVALVVDRNHILYEGAAGKADVARNVDMPTNAIFQIASMTRPVTSVAIMMLIEQGKLKLDDQVQKYLPGFDHEHVIINFNAKDATYDTRPAKSQITIRELLTHTSGIGYSFTNPIEYRLTMATKKEEWQLPLINDPGTKWNYSASTRVLGMVVEKITGTNLEEYYQQHIFKPLGMMDTSYLVPGEKRSRLPKQYNRVGAELKESPNQLFNPSTSTNQFRGDGGLFSTVEDYGKFMRMFLNGGKLGSARILSETSVKMMGQNNIGPLFVGLQPDANKALTKPFPLGAGHDKFGLGFQLASNNPQYAAYSSPGSMSWAGIFNTEFWIDPVKHIAAVQMMQVLPFYDDGAIRTLRGFEKIVYKDLQ